MCLVLERIPSCLVSSIFFKCLQGMVLSARASTCFVGKTSLRVNTSFSSSRSLPPMKSVKAAKDGVLGVRTVVLTRNVQQQGFLFFSVGCGTACARQQGQCICKKNV